MGLIHDFLSNKNPNESYWRLLTEICHLMPALPFEGKAHDYTQHVVMSLSKRTSLSCNEILRTARNFASHTKDCSENKTISLFTIHDYPRLEYFVKDNIEIHASIQKKILNEIFQDHIKNEFELTIRKNFLSQIYLNRFHIFSLILYFKSIKIFPSLFQNMYRNMTNEIEVTPSEKFGISILYILPLLMALNVAYYSFCIIYYDINMTDIESFKKLKSLDLDMSEQSFFQEKDIKTLYSIIFEMIKNIPAQEREELNFWLVNSFSFQ